MSSLLPILTLGDSIMIPLLPIITYLSQGNLHNLEEIDQHRLQLHAETRMQPDEEFALCGQTHDVVVSQGFLDNRAWSKLLPFDDGR